jgi:tetratricopeptide (TPR) repeat protein
LLAAINEQTPSEHAFAVKITQLRLERNYLQAVQLFQARPTQFHFDSDDEKASDQLAFALVQRLAGDTAGAKITAERARNTLEQLCRDQPDDANLAGMLSQANAALGEKDSALKEAERAIMLLPSAKNAVDGPAMEENLAVIQTMFGENSSAISTLTRLLRTRGNGWLCDTPVTPALLRLDPIWTLCVPIPLSKNFASKRSRESVAAAVELASELLQSTGSKLIVSKAATVLLPVSG